MHNTSSCGVFYPKDDALKAAIPADMLKAAQDQHSNNQDARIVRLRQLLCPLLGDLNSRNDFIVLSVENPLIEDADLVDVLALDLPEIMQIWEARPISIFDCLHPACRAPTPSETVPTSCGSFAWRGTSVCGSELGT